MNKLIEVVGASGAGKTALVHALAKTGKFVTAYEEHAERPFQALFKNDARYALANQIDYLLLRAEQETQLRTSTSAQTGIMDGGLDLDFHGFTRLFHHHGLLTDSEFDLCQRFYIFLREKSPLPEIIIHLVADEKTVVDRLFSRERINIASPEDTALFNSFLIEWLANVPSHHVIQLDVSSETVEYEQSVEIILNRI